MKIARYAIRSLTDVSSLRPCRPIVSRRLSTNAKEDPSQNRNSSESLDDWMLGGFTGNNDDKSNGFYQHLGKAEKDKRDYSGFNRSSSGSRFSRDESFDPSSDGVDGKLKEAALYNLDDDEGVKDGYFFRPDFNNFGINQFPKDLNYKKQMQRPRQNNNKFEVTTKQVLENADFRNVRFLAQFITEAGIIIQRKTTGISAKAQRKIAREIKTARAFGLMPFTTMGTKAFQFGKTMENRDQDFEYEALDDEEYENEAE